MRFNGGLKNGSLIWSFLIVGFFVFLPMTAHAALNCWDKYPTGGTPIPGFPKATDFQSSACSATKDACTSQGSVAIDGFGCVAPQACCLKPAKSLGACYNDYVGDDRTIFQSTSCVKSDAQCASPNKKLGDGHGCSDANGGTVCCAIIKSSNSKSGSTAGSIPQTGSTAAWKYQNPEKTGLLLVDCTKDGNCTIDDIVQQGVNFAKWVMGLAGALFLLVFVYGGAMYAVSFGRSDYITKGKNALVRGAFGVILVMGAWTIVSYVATSLGYTGMAPTGTNTGTDDACAKKAGYSCMMVTPEQEKSQYLCESKLCMSNKDPQYKCCVQAPSNK
ncbi:MAG: pilin [Patescibacteria group bacterium]|nr:pilin [Patescibacteria group bacterium]